MKIKFKTISNIFCITVAFLIGIHLLILGSKEYQFFGNWFIAVGVGLTMISIQNFLKRLFYFILLTGVTIVAIPLSMKDGDWEPRFRKIIDIFKDYILGEE